MTDARNVKGPLGQYLSLHAATIGDLQTACAYAKQRVKDADTDPLTRNAFAKLVKAVAWSEETHSQWEVILRDRIAERCMAAVMARTGWADVEAAAAMAFEAADAFLAARSIHMDEARATAAPAAPLMGEPPPPEIPE